MYFELFSHNYTSRTEIDLYFKHTTSNIAKDFYEKILEKKFKSSPMLKKRLNFEPCEDDLEDSQYDGELFRELGLDDSEEDENIYVNDEESFPLKSRD